MNSFISYPSEGLNDCRISGIVYGTLLNHRPALAALGDQVNNAPYKAKPVAPVLYVKPRNTLANDGDKIVVPNDAPLLEVGGALGIVIGKTACNLSSDNAMEHVAGYTIVNDISVPHDSFYRPSIRFKARDGFCPIGPKVVPRSVIPNPDALQMQVFVDGELTHETNTANRIRNVTQLLVDVTEFMTLQPGDVLMLGVSADAPRVRAGQEVSIEMEGIGKLTNRFVKEGVSA